MNIRKRSGRLLFSYLTSLTLLLPGCTTIDRTIDRMTEEERPLTPAEVQMRQQAVEFDRTIWEGVAAGAALGMATGAVIGYSSTNQNRGVAAGIGAGIGLVVGGITGAFVGNYYANKKMEYVDQEERLNAVISDIQAQNQKLETLIQSTRTVVARDIEKIEEVNSQVVAKKITKEQAEKELRAVDDNKEVIEDAIEDLKERRDDWKTTAQDALTDTNSPKVANINEEIVRLEEQINLMQNELDALVSRRTSVVG